MQAHIKKRGVSAGYWTDTIFTALGYPAYFVTILGAWKVLGSLAILAPRLPHLKEWAYAGIAFDLRGQRSRTRQ